MAERFATVFGRLCSGISVAITGIEPLRRSSAIIGLFIAGAFVLSLVDEDSEGITRPRQPSRLDDRSVASVSMPAPQASSASACGHRISRPTPFRKIPRTITRK